MGKRKNGEGSWATVTKKGYTYKRFRSPEGTEFFGKTEKEAKAKHMQWKEKGKKPIIKNRDKSVGKKYVLDSTSPKRKASERYVPLSDKAYEIIQYFYNNYPHEDTNHVFCNDAGNYAGRRNVSRTIKSMLKAAGCEVQDASPHDLRHSFGSELIRHGKDIKVVSELMGHQDIQTTYNIYIHILSEQKVDAIEIFNKFD